MISSDNTFHILLPVSDVKVMLWRFWPLVLLWSKWFDKFVLFVFQHLHENANALGALETMMRQKVLQCTRKRQGRRQWWLAVRLQNIQAMTDFIFYSKFTVVTEHQQHIQTQSLSSEPAVLTLANDKLNEFNWQKFEISSMTSILNGNSIIFYSFI